MVGLNSGSFGILGWYSFDDAMINKYIRARVVAGGLKVISNTVASGAFAVTGVINAIGYSSLPPLTTVDEATILSYARDNSRFTAGEPVSSGVAVLLPPDLAKEFVQPDDPVGVINTGPSTPPDLYQVMIPDEVVKWQFGSVSPAWLNPSLPPDTPFGGTWTLVPAFDSSAVNTGPVNKIGRGKMNFQFRLGNTSPNTGIGPLIVRVQFRQHFRKADSSTWVVSDVFEQTDKFFTEYGVVDTGTYPAPYWNFAGEFDFELKAPCFKLELLVGVQSYGSSGVGPFSLSAGYGGIEFYDLGLVSGLVSPGALVTVNGLGAQQNVGLTGSLVMEGVPDSSLARDLSTQRRAPSNPLEYEIAVALLNNDSKYRGIYSYPTYSKLFLDQPPSVWAAGRRTVVEAADFKTGFKRFLTGLKGVFNASKPVLRALTPVAAAALASNPKTAGFAPVASALGTAAFARDYARDYADDWAAAAPSPFDRGVSYSADYCSDEEEDQGKPVSGSCLGCNKQLHSLESFCGTFCESLYRERSVKTDRVTYPPKVDRIATVPQPKKKVDGQPRDLLDEAQTLMRDAADAIRVYQDTADFVRVGKHYEHNHTIVIKSRAPVNVDVFEDDSCEAVSVYRYDGASQAADEFDSPEDEMAFLRAQLTELQGRLALTKMVNTATVPVSSRPDVVDNAITSLATVCLSFAYQTQMQGVDKARFLSAVGSNLPKAFKAANLPASDSWASYNAFVTVTKNTAGESHDSEFHRLFVTPFPLTSHKGQHVSTYTTFEVHGVKLHVDERLQDVNAETIADVWTLSAVQSIAEKDVYLTVDSPARSQYAIAGHSWHASAYLALNFSPIVVSTGSLRNPPGELAEKADSCVTNGRVLVVLNPMPASIVRVDAVMKGTQFAAVTLDNFFKMSGKRKTLIYVRTIGELVSAAYFFATTPAFKTMAVRREGSEDKDGNLVVVRVSDAASSLPKISAAEARQLEEEITRLYNEGGDKAPYFAGTISNTGVKTGGSTLKEFVEFIHKAENGQSSVARVNNVMQQVKDFIAKSKKAKPAKKTALNMLAGSKLLDL